jgi:amino acid permease
MNVQRSYIIISTTAFATALLFFAVYNQLILFCSPWATHVIVNNPSVMQKKQVTHYYFHGDKWKTEKQELLWTESNEKNIFQLINAWLTLLDEEHITAKRVLLQSALISTAGCLYLSFDHNVLSKEETIFKKWMIIEGLLKTLALNSIIVSHVQFLIQHKQIQDAHLDFSFPWPTHGFN